MRTDPRPTILYVLPASIVLVALAALVALPLFINSRTSGVTHEIESKAVPARVHLNQVNYDLGAQVSNLLRWSVSENAGEIAAYREGAHRRQQAMDLLEKDIAAIGEAVPAARFRELKKRIAHWEQGVDRQLRERTRGAAAHTVFAGERSRYTAVVEQVEAVDDALEAFESERRAEVRGLMQLQVWLSAGLVLIALVAAAAVLWLLSNVRAMAEREREARSSVESLLKARDEILGIVSHDLRSPLTTITLSTQLLPGSPPAEQAEHVETIMATARRMQRLIQDLLDAVKIENTALAVNKEIVDPTVIVKTAAESQKPIAAEKQIALTTDIVQPLPQISGDSDRLVQALVNLLGNALKFTPPGGVVHLRAAVTNAAIEVSITDSGPGIPPNELPHLFEPFWQSKKTAHLGAGLGLKITRAIVEAHGGSIDVGNAPAGGACFTVSIPLAS